jgi:hypothetical protein
MGTVKLIRVEAGEYKTADGRFRIRNTYDPSGAPWVRNGSSPKWRVEDKQTGKSFKMYTLADVRSELACICK